MYLTKSADACCTDIISIKLMHILSYNDTVIHAILTTSSLHA